MKNKKYSYVGAKFKKQKKEDEKPKRKYQKKDETTSEDIFSNKYFSKNDDIC